MNECDDDIDEVNCDIPDWFFPTLLAVVVFSLSAVLFGYLLKLANSSIKHMIMESPKAGKVSSTSKKVLQIAILVAENAIREVNDFYEKEVEIHGNESNAICCLKVIIRQSSI